MEIKLTNNSESTVIELIGRLDTAASEEFQSAVDKVLAGAPKKFILDCKNLDYIASSGLRTLLFAYKQLTPKGGQLVVTDVKPEVMDILKLTGFTTFLSIE